MFCKSFCNFHKLLFSNAYILDQSTGRFFQSYCFQIFICFSVSFIPVNGKCRPFFVSKIHVFPDCHIGDQCQFLMNNNNPFFFTVLNVCKSADLTIVDNVSLIGTIRINSTENVHQGGLSCTVFSYQRMDLALFYFQIYIIQCLYTRESLGNIFHFQKYFRQ